MEKVQIGKVIEFYTNSCLVLSEEKTYNCMTPKNHEVAVGDNVEILVQSSSAIISKIHDRSSALYRFRRQKKRLLAANLTNIGIILASVPLAPRLFIDKWLTIADGAKLEPFLVFNKSDLELSQEFEDTKDLYANLNLPYFITSFKENFGISELKNHLENKTCIFVGQSGVGKTSLTGALTGINLKTKVLSNEQGQHTTSTSRLFKVENVDGSIIDSPGVRDIEQGPVSKSSIKNVFHEITEASKKCQFRNCGHKKDKGCFVKEGVEEGLINQSRYDSFLELVKNIDE
jgi:ribosome biogenesis GTPase